MISYVFCYCKVDKWSFIDSSLGLNDLRDLRLGKITYEQILNRISAFENSQFIFINDDYPNTTQKLLSKVSNHLIGNNIYLEYEDSVAVLNLQYFPKDINLLSCKLEQAEAASIPLIISEKDSENKICAVIFKSKNLKELNLPFDTPVFEAPERTFIDLYAPSEVMDLFNEGLVLRNFNSMTKGRTGYFLKHSKQKNKMKAEHEFLSSLPTAIRPFYPCCGDYIENIGNGEAGYEIELVPTLDVAKFLINSFFSSSERCQDFLNAIDRYVNAVPHKKVSVDEYKNKMTELFVRKGEKRLDALSKVKCISRLNQIVNLFGFESVNAFGKDYLELIKKDVESISDTEIYCAHGDLFFGNMLYDPSKKILKLVDPKGGSTEENMMPIWYDMAKLSHSFLGNYDLMVYGLITPYLDDSLELSLKIQKAFRRSCKLLSNEFIRYLSEKKIDIRRVRLYEGSLFLSMLPLHEESPLRMSCQLIKALEIYKYITNTEKEK